MKKLLIPLIFFISLPVLAQQTVQVIQLSINTSNASGTISTTNTFQQVFASSSSTNQQLFSSRGRTSCTIQNNGSNTMYVFFGPIANATTLNSFQIFPNQSISCQVNNATLQDQVSITGTSSDAFTATQQ